MLPPFDRGRDDALVGFEPLDDCGLGVVDMLALEERRGHRRPRRRPLHAGAGVPKLGERTTALMVVATELTGGETYTVVAERTLGRAGSVVTAAALIALNYGVCVSYLIVVKDLLPWEPMGPRRRRAGLLLCLAAVAVGHLLVPLSAMEKMDHRCSTALTSSA